MIRVFKRVLIGAVVLFVVVSFAYVIAVSVLQSQVNAQLGFNYATPETEERGEIFEITEVVPDKPMYRAGLREGDIIPWDDVSVLYRMLVYNQGGTISLPILRSQRYLEVRVKVPKLDLFTQPKWIYGI